MNDPLLWLQRETNLCMSKELPLHRSTFPNEVRVKKILCSWNCPLTSQRMSDEKKSWSFPPFPPLLCIQWDTRELDVCLHLDIWSSKRRTGLPNFLGSQEKAKQTSSVIVKEVIGFLLFCHSVGGKQLVTLGLSEWKPRQNIQLNFSLLVFLELFFIH